ncbi:MAG: type II secretion system F family protein [Acidimicrobiales bacterium]
MTSTILDTETPTESTTPGAPRTAPRRRRRAVGTPTPTAAPPSGTGRPLETFDYVAVDNNGQRVSGQLTAASPREAIDRIRRQQLRPVRLRTSRTSLFQREFSIPGIGATVKPRELAAFTRQFATMVGAGIPLIRSLTVLAQQNDNPIMVRVLEQVRFDVEAGDSLSRSITRHPRVFDHLYCSMVAAGEESGALEEVLRQLATSQERAVLVRQKIRSAMSYPTAVLVMVTGVIAVMLRFVVPRFATIYTDLGGTLPCRPGSSLPHRISWSADRFRWSSSSR